MAHPLWGAGPAGLGAACLDNAGVGRRDRVVILEMADLMGSRSWSLLDDVRAGQDSGTSVFGVWVFESLVLDDW